MLTKLVYFAIGSGDEPDANFPRDFAFFMLRLLLRGGCELQVVLID